MTDGQQQIRGMNQQYDQLGESLCDHQRELQYVLLGVTAFSQDYDRILLWLHCTEQELNSHDEQDDETRQVRMPMCCAFFVRFSIPKYDRPISYSCMCNTVNVDVKYMLLFIACKMFRV